MKKLLSIMLVLTMALTLLAGCGGTSNTPKDNKDKTNNDKTNDTVYTLTVVNHDSASSLGEQWLEGLLNAISEESTGW